jgi:hypothetical protein
MTRGWSALLHGRLCHHLELVASVGSSRVCAARSLVFLSPRNFGLMIPRPVTDLTSLRRLKLLRLASKQFQPLLLPPNFGSLAAILTELVLESADWPTIPQVRCYAAGLLGMQDVAYSLLLSMHVVAAPSWPVCKMYRRPWRTCRMFQSSNSCCACFHSSSIGVPGWQCARDPEP